MKDALAKKQVDRIGYQGEKAGGNQFEITVGRSWDKTTTERKGVTYWRPFAAGQAVKRHTAEWKEDRTARDSQLAEYQKGVTEQIEEKNEQIGDLQEQWAHPLSCHRSRMVKMGGPWNQIGLAIRWEQITSLQKAWDTTYVPPCDGVITTEQQQI